MLPSITYIWVDDVWEVPLSFRHSPMLERLAEARTAASDHLYKGPSSSTSLPTLLLYVLKMVILEYHPNGTWKCCYSHAQMRTGAERLLCGSGAWTLGGVWAS